MEKRKPAIYKAFIPTPAIEKEVLRLENELGYYGSTPICRAMEIAIKGASSPLGEPDYLRALKVATGEFLAEKLEEALGAFGEFMEIHVRGSFEETEVEVLAGIYSAYLTDEDNLRTLYAQYTGFLDEFRYLAGLADVSFTLQVEDSFFSDNEFKEILEDLLGQESPEKREEILSEWLKPNKNHKQGGKR